MRRLVCLALLVASPAYAVDCPPNMKTCKVWFLSPEVEQILVQPNGILATAAQARTLDLAAATQFLRAQIENAEKGEVKVEKTQEQAPQEKK